MTSEEIIDKLSKTLKKKRFNHVISVAYTAANLAMRYEYDINDAFRAGLLHDCSKYLSDKDQISYCKKNKIILSDIETANPALIHAKSGAVLANKEYDEENTAILEAIKWHTTGKPEMSLLEKIIFVADFIEPNRDFDNDLLGILRKEAYDNIDRCVCHIYKRTIEHISSSSKKLDPIAQEAYIYYKNLIGE